ncbi:MAG: type II toxin-antitoxin system prevent-host-death family antitoxin [Bacteroidetes bacterium]|nr:type II toxin-antitoxin system prevent-host-death family antitoxin [Bacteroidota bacterium]
MNVITHNDLKQNLDIYMDRVIQGHQPIIISKQNNEKVMLISVDEYNSLVETNYLLSNESNSEHLKTSIAQHKSGKIISKALYE